jgi:hypothetical protein
MPIEGVSDIRRFPRLGKIRLGVKREKGSTTYPQAVDFFVCPEEVQEVHGEKPQELPIMFPADDLDLVAPQWYKCYSYTHGLICKGDGKTCRRKVDKTTGDFASHETKKWALAEGICVPGECPKIGNKQCRKVMCLQFILPEVPGLGVYQLDTSSFYSIVNINSQLAPDGFIRQFTRGKISFIPLILSIGPQVVTPPGEGRKTVHVLNVRAEVKLADIIRISRQAPYQVLLPPVEEEEPPDDLFPGEVIGNEVPEEELFPEENGASLSEDDRDISDSDGPPIDLVWLKESLAQIKWTETTAKTWLSSHYGVAMDGNLEKALSELTREQAEEFTREINERVSQRQPKLME